MKLFFNIALVVAMAIFTFMTFGVLPVFVKVVWIIAFILFWFGRKFIQENVISYLQAHTVNPDSGDNSKMSAFFAKIESFIWVTDSGEKTGTDAWKYKRSPNKESLKMIRHIVSILILFVFIGIPAIISGILGLIGGIIGGIGNFFNMLGQDITFVNGVGFFILAILEALTTMVAIAMVVLCFIKRKDICCSLNIVTNVFGKPIVAKFLVIATAVSVFLQRFISWFYFEYSFGDVIGEIISVAIVIVAIFGISFLRKCLKNRRTIDIDDDDDASGGPFA